MMRFSRLAALAAALIATTPCIAEVPGGSNYGWYAVKDCIRDPYAVLPNIDVASDDIRHQLQIMHDHGQRRLRIPIFFAHDAPANGYLNASSSGLSEQDRKKVESLLKVIRSVGFDQIIIAFFAGLQNYADWEIWQQKYYDENLLVITQVREIARNSGLNYIIDLQNEGIPASNQPMLLKYTKQLWADYTKRFGSEDTLGFSLIPDADRVIHLRDVYAGNNPTKIDLHIYSNARQTVNRMRTALFAAGFASVPWIIGETFYNDDEELQSIRDAMEASGPGPLFIIQWPAKAHPACKDVDLVPLDNSATIAHPPLVSHTISKER